MALKPWYKVVTPREDLRDGKPLDASEFAVHLDHVRDGKAPAVYQNPVEFFERTFLTKNLKELAGQVVRRLNGIPLTLPARTLLDLAATETQRDLERALSEARVLKLVSDKQLLHAIDRTPSRKGTKALRVLLDHGPAITRSEAERRLLKLIRDANLPLPLTNVRLHGHTVDFCWPENRLIVEFDGFAFHGHRRAFERDRKRDRTLVAAGYRVIRITWRQLTDESLAVIASVAQALTAAA